MENTVHVRYFAGFREEVGKRSEEIEIENSIKLGDFIAQLVAKHPEIETLISSSAFSVNLDICEPESTTVKPGDEIALLPPVGGG